MNRHRCFLMAVCITVLCSVALAGPPQALDKDDWLALSTEERLAILGRSLSYVPSGTFIGDFNPYADLYRRWGYDYYEMNDSYENYAFRGFTPYNIIEERRRRWSYNEFGDRIGRLTHEGVVWRETHDDEDGISVVSPTGYINSVVSGGIDGVWVAREATDDWAVSVIGAGSLRCSFTPLTLSIPNLNGARMDLQTATMKGAFVTSSMLGPESHGYLYGPEGEPPEKPVKDYPATDREGVLLRSGYLRRTFGALTLGASYVNLYGIQANRQNGGDRRGTVSDFTPTPMMIAVRFRDDSPEDGAGGAYVKDVWLRVDGHRRDDIIPTIYRDDITRDQTTAITDRTQMSYLTPSRAGMRYDMLNMEARLPKYADYLYYQEYLNGNNMESVDKKFSIERAKEYYERIDPGSVPLRADGTSCLVFLYDLAGIETHVNRVEVAATVANDYHIETAYIYTRNSGGGHDTTGNPFNHYDATYWRTAAYADGNVTDFSNQRTLTMDIGVQVAETIYGLDMAFSMGGLDIRGEYASGVSHYMYPDNKPGTGLPQYELHTERTGYRWGERDSAWYLVGDWQRTRWGVSGEVFSMGGGYRPYLDYVSNLSTRYLRINDLAMRNHTVRIPLVEDNDDNDKYPDTMYICRNMEYNGYRSNIIDPDGVYPGNDLDRDGIPDTDRNNNEIHDSQEVFLSFDTDPDEFIYGTDYNSNGIPDIREDDIKPDTPYDLNRRGHHLSVRFTPAPPLDLHAGTMRTRSNRGENRSNIDYVKAVANRSLWGDLGLIHGEYRIERIQDSVRDPVLRSALHTETHFTATYMALRQHFYSDDLEYRNSRVHRLYVDVDLRPWRWLNLRHHVKYEHNRRLQGELYDGGYQPGQVSHTLAIVDRYTVERTVGEVNLLAGVKHRLYRKDLDNIPRPGCWYDEWIPLVKAQWSIAPHTSLTGGAQGFGPVPYVYSDHTYREYDLERRTYLVQIENNSLYFGYRIWSSVGWRLDDFAYRRAMLSDANYRSTSLFVKVLLGF